jgi:sporulation protein YlmC with PRC-barrel domain
MKDGAKIGTVKDLVFRGVDLLSLVVDGERGEGLLPFECVNESGPDAVMIEDVAGVAWSSGLYLEPGTRNAHDLKLLSVVDAEGNNLGRIHDFTMNAKGRMQKLFVRTEGVFGIGSHEQEVPESRIRAIGPDMITVDMPRK